MRTVVYTREELDQILEAVPESHGILFRSELVAGVYLAVWRRLAVPNRAVRYVIQGGFRAVELIDLGHPTVTYGVGRGEDPVPLIRGSVSLFLAPRECPGTAPGLRRSDSDGCGGDYKPGDERSPERGGEGL